jgi:hypothetical protein
MRSKLHNGNGVQIARNLVVVSQQTDDGVFTPAPTQSADGVSTPSSPSRKPTWDTASQLRGEMFREVATIGGLSLQLVYYRVYDECRASPWTSESSRLLRLMEKVDCLAGITQILRVLGHTQREAAKEPVSALVFVGDAMEESPDMLVSRARELGRLGVPVFMFQEGDDPVACSAFRDIAKHSGGAYGRFDAGAAKQLGELLKAVAIFATGGMKALEGRKDAGSVLLLGQLKGGGA